MKYIFGIIVFVHGLIHILGFVNGFDLKEIKELSLPISKSFGILWLTAALLFLSFGIAYFSNTKYAWLLGFVSVVVSQILIIVYWEDARFGTIPNILVLAVCGVLFGYYHFQNLVQKEIEEMLSQNIVNENRILSEKDISELPVPVKNWLKNSGVIGRPFISVGKVSQKAEMKMKPEQEKWMTATAIQYTTIENPAFIWFVDVKMNSLLNFQGRDKFVDGKGEMFIKINSLFNVVNERGEKIDEGTFQRYLGEMVWFPSLAVSPFITWEQIDENTAKATMTYKGTSGSGNFYFNSNGDITKFSALRYKGNETDAKRYNWEMTILDYKTFEGIKVPAKMTSTWKLDDKDWTWLKLEVTDIKYNKNASH
ncbi:MAG: DUF6544 family protein [candidate division WOR-3 bacterium]